MRRNGRALERNTEKPTLLLRILDVLVRGRCENVVLSDTYPHHRCKRLTINILKVPHNEHCTIEKAERCAQYGCFRVVIPRRASSCSRKFANLW